MKPTVARGSLYPEQNARAIIPAQIPVIYTKRLYLRPSELTDATDIFEYRARHDVAKFLWPNVPHTEIQETEAVIARKTFTTPDASGVVGRRFHFSISELDDPSKKVIGTVGINSLAPAPSVGYGIHPDFWGKGYASEAVRGLTDAWWKLERKEPETNDVNIQPEGLFALCNQANVGSVKVLLKNGFEKYRELELRGDTIVLFRIQRPELKP